MVSITIGKTAQPNYTCIFSRKIQYPNIKIFLIVNELTCDPVSLSLCLTWSDHSGTTCSTGKRNGVNSSENQGELESTIIDQTLSNINFRIDVQVRRCLDSAKAYLDMYVSTPYSQA